MNEWTNERNECTTAELMLITPLSVTIPGQPLSANVRNDNTWQIAAILSLPFVFLGISVLLDEKILAKKRPTLMKFGDTWLRYYAFFLFRQTLLYLFTSFIFRCTRWQCFQIFTNIYKLTRQTLYCHINVFSLMGMKNKVVRAPSCDSWSTQVQISSSEKILIRIIIY